MFEIEIIERGNTDGDIVVGGAAFGVDLRVVTTPAGVALKFWGTQGAQVHLRCLFR